MKNIMLALPEITMLVLACATLLVDVFVKQGRQRLWTFACAQATLGIGIVLLLGHWGAPGGVTFHGLFVLDPLAVLLKVFVLGIVFFTFLYARHYLPEFGVPVGEFYLLGLFSTLGMMVLVSSAHFLPLYLGLELLSLPIYAMVALRRESPVCAEAAMKYFVIGAMASGLLLYGISMIYGATGSLELASVAKVVGTIAPSQNLVVLFGLVFMLVGLAFKLGMVPFHMWVPDVYQGAPSAVTLFISAAPKVAGLALFLRILVYAVPQLQSAWQQILIAIAILSIGLGNVTAVVQTNMKRLLAYSSIAHMGYMALGLLVGTKQGYAAATFYMVTYALMSVGAFGALTMLSGQGIEVENIDDFKGLNRRNPGLACMMLLLFFSLAGVPPLVGFMAKIAVLHALVQQGFVWLAVVALLFAVVGAYYYIRVVKVMYFDEPVVEAPFVYTYGTQAAMILNSGAVLLLGILPGFLYSWCVSVF